MSATYSKSDVSSHNKPDSLWIIVDDDVYDLSKFQVNLSSSVTARISLIVELGRTPWWKEDPPKSRRQGRLQAVLEVPQ